MRKTLFWVALLMFLGVTALQAKVRLPSVFSDNMVLQQNSMVAIWGTSDKGKKVSICPSWTKTRFTAVPSGDGNWSVRIPTPSAGGPYSITFSDGDKTTLSNILIGEVWFCSGQSNMEMPMAGFTSQPVEGGTDYIINAKPSRPIRMCTVKRAVSLKPLDSCEGTWEENNPESVAKTSAVAYFFALKLQDALNVPVGLLISDWGGTPIEAWMNRESLEKDFSGEFDLSFLDGDVLPEKPQKRPCTLFNGQVAPLIPFTFKGMLWYQGEDNRKRAEQYSRLQPAYVAMMREQFQAPDAPFYFVQIAPYKYSNPDKFSNGVFYEMQEKTLSLIPNSGMAATVDIGEFGTIHPCKKKEVGDRLALLALTKTYGIKGIDAESPSFKSVSFTGGKALVTFNVGARGLSPIGQDLTGFEIAGEDRVFHPAVGRVTKTVNVEVSSPEVHFPVAVRYCWRNWSVGTLYNCFGIPALPFRTDDWETGDESIFGDIVWSVRDSLMQPGLSHTLTKLKNDEKFILSCLVNLTGLSGKEVRGISVRKNETDRLLLGVQLLEGCPSVVTYRLFGGAKVLQDRTSLPKGCKEVYLRLAFSHKRFRFYYSLTPSPREDASKWIRYGGAFDNWITGPTPLIALKIENAPDIPDWQLHPDTREPMDSSLVFCTAPAATSCQGMGIWKDKCVIIHDKGWCEIVGLRSGKTLSYYTLDGNDSHCNNAVFSNQKLSDTSEFPLMYISECYGDHSCMVTDIGKDSSRIVQKIYYDTDGSDYPGPFDWLIDRDGGYLCTYGGTRWGHRYLHFFPIPSLDEKEVHLKRSDAVKTMYYGDLGIGQGAFVHDGQAYFTSGYPPYVSYLHLYDTETGLPILRQSLKPLLFEPEGIDIRDGYVYVVFWCSGKRSKLYKFKL